MPVDIGFGARTPRGRVRRTMSDRVAGVLVVVGAVLVLLGGTVLAADRGASDELLADRCNVPGTSNYGEAEWRWAPPGRQCTYDEFGRPDGPAPSPVPSVALIAGLVLLGAGSHRLYRSTFRAP